MTLTALIHQPFKAAWLASVYSFSGVYNPNALNSGRNPCYLMRLPPELHLAIVDLLLARPDRVALLRSSSYFYRLLAPRFYRTIVLTGDYDRMIRILVNIAQNPHFAKHVRNLYIRPNCEEFNRPCRTFFFDPDKLGKLESLWPLLRWAILQLENLDTLVLPSQTAGYAYEDRLNNYGKPRRHIPNVSIEPSYTKTGWFAVHEKGWDIPLVPSLRNTPGRFWKPTRFAHGCTNDRHPRACNCIQPFMEHYGHYVTALTAYSTFFNRGRDTYFSPTKPPLCPNLERLEITTNKGHVGSAIETIQRGVFPSLHTLIVTRVTEKRLPNRQWQFPEMSDFLDRISGCRTLTTVIDHNKLAWRRANDGVWNEDPNFVLPREWYEAPEL